MSDPRMIPADEAREALTEIMSVPPKRRGTGAERRIELLETVIAQAARIAELESELHAVAQHDLAQGCKLRAKTVEADRVRTELEALRDYYIDREDRSRERLESVTDEREQFHLARFEHMHRRTHEALTRILEGDTDEWRDA